MPYLGLIGRLVSMSAGFEATDLGKLVPFGIGLSMLAIGYREERQWEAVIVWLGEPSLGTSGDSSIVIMSIVIMPIVFIRGGRAVGGW